MHGSINNIVMLMLFIRIICKKKKKKYVYIYIYIYEKKMFLDWSELFGENITSLYNV